MTPALDVCFPIGARAVANGQIHQPQVEFGRSENQIEISKRIKLAEIGRVASERFVILAEQDFGSAKSILELLSQQPTEGEAEKFVGHHIQELHGLLLHRIHQSDTIYKLRSTGTSRFIELWQLFRRHG